MPKIRRGNKGGSADEKEAGLADEQVEETDSANAIEISGEQKNQQRKGGGYLSAYKRAQLTYERLRAERKMEAERQRAERERQKEEADFNKEWRKKKNQALLLRTQKGQPNLNAQIGVLLEKLEKDRQK